MKLNVKRSAVTVGNNLDATTLKAHLWDTLRAVKSGKMSPTQGDVIAVQAREILRCVKTQLSIFSQASKSVSPELLAFANPRDKTHV